MKKIISLAFLLCSFISFSQYTDVIEDENVYKRDITNNELSIGAFNLVVFGALDVAYERIITQNTSWAVEAFILALTRESDWADGAYNKNASLTGKFKYFFGDERAAGFYVNGLAMISGGEFREDGTYLEDNRYVEGEEGDYTDLALGFGVGGKFVSKQGFFIDLGTGIGRNLLSDDSPTIVGQFTVNLGFRF